MQVKDMGSRAARHFVLVMETGDNLEQCIMEFAREHNVRSAYFSAIGALSGATLAWFSLEKKDYEKIPVDEQVEVASLTGNIAMFEGEPKLHIHAVVGKRDGTTVGGHVVEATVRPTLEVVLFELAEGIDRQMIDHVGLPLIRV